VTWPDPLEAGRQPSEWLNVCYQPALRLAELVLRATSIELGGGGVAVNGLLLDMPWIFEEFVTAALREALESVTAGGSTANW
jgi:5-methylcytosine-specific restriction enzyme subunit McrC